MVDVRLTVSSNRFPELARRYPELARAIVQKTGLDIVAGCQMRSRVDTGQMRAGWQFEMTGATEGEVYNNVEHTVYNEFGTRYMTAQPMLAPAVDEAQPQFEAAVARALDG